MNNDFDFKPIERSSFEEIHEPPVHETKKMGKFEAFFSNIINFFSKNQSPERTNRNIHLSQIDSSNAQDKRATEVFSTTYNPIPQNIGNVAVVADDPLVLEIDEPPYAPIPSSFLIEQEEIPRQPSESGIQATDESLYVPLKEIEGEIVHQEPNLPTHDATTRKTTLVFTETLFKGVTLTSITPKIGEGISKAAYRLSLSKHAFKEIKSQIKLKKNIEEIFSLTQISSFFQKIIKKIQSIWNKIPEPSLMHILESRYLAAKEDFEGDNFEPLNNFMNEMKNLARKLNPQFEKNQELKTLYPNLANLCSKPILNKSDFTDDLERKNIFNELENLFNKSVFNIVVSKPKESEKEKAEVDNVLGYSRQYQKEIDQANFVRKGVEKISSSFKKFLAVPLTITTREGQKRIIDQFYNLGDVKQLMSAGQLTTDEKWKAAIHSAKGLSTLHQAKIVHCDFAARNVLAKHTFDKNGKYDLSFAVSDWGLALKAGEPIIKNAKDNINIALLWASPEIIGSKMNQVGITSKSDVWSYGVTLLEMMEPEGNIHNILNLPNNNHAIAVYNSPKSHMKNMIDQYEQGKGFSMDRDPELKELKELILSCFSDLPEHRPSMDEVTAKLESLQSRGTPLSFHR
jgi:hypothetical protein